MRRVVFLKSGASFRGGLEKYTHYLMRAFAEKGCAVTLLTTGETPSIEGITSISLAPNTKFTFYQLLHFNSLCQKWVKKKTPEVVFGMERTTRQTHYRAGNGVHAIYLQRRKLIDPFWKQLTLSFNPLHRQILSIEKEAFEDPNLKVLFTNSKMVRDEILNTYEIPETKIAVVHNGVEWKNWGQEFEQTLQNQKVGPFQLLFIGNGYKRKGLLYLLQGLERLKKEDFQLTVIGKDKNPKFFIDWVSKNHLKEKIFFLGPQNAILSFYKKADALVIPSIYDPFANVTVEALAMGLFVVSSCYNGGQEVLQDYSGTVIPELTDPDSVATALKKAFENPKTPESAFKIRQSVQGLDFSCQLDKIVSKTLGTI